MERHRTARRTASIREDPTIHFRPMRASDLPQIAQIEARAYPYPWTDEYFSHCLQAGFCCRVLERNGVIEAYGIMSVESDSAHLLNLCVRPASQRRGLGGKMLIHLLEQARRHLARTAFLEVRPSNLPACNLYRSMGFKQIGVQEGYYHLARGHEDALIMMRRL